MRWNEKKIFMVVTSFVILLHGLFLLSYFNPVPAGVDSYGYYRQAINLLLNQQTWFSLESPLQFIDCNWTNLLGEEYKANTSPSTVRYFSIYPPGLAVFIAFFWLIGGLKFASLLNILATTLSLIALYFLSAHFMKPRWALVSVLFMAVNPVLNQRALTGDSHSVVLCLFLFGLLGINRLKDSPSAILALFTGIMFGLMATIRYSEFVLCVIAGFYLLYLSREKKITVKQLIFSALGMVIPLSIVALRNYFVFGNPAHTGYAELGVDIKGFSLAYFPENFIFYIKYLNSLGLGPLLSTGFLGICLMTGEKRSRGHGLFYGAISTSIFLLYVFYHWNGGDNPWLAMRFFSPLVPILAIATAWLLSRLSMHIPLSSSAFIAVTLLLFIASWGLTLSCGLLHTIEQYTSQITRIDEFLEKEVETGSVLIVENDLAQHLDLENRYKIAEESIFTYALNLNILYRNVDPHADVFLYLRHKRAANLREFYEGYRGKELIARIINELFRWSEGRPLYWLVSENQSRLPDILKNWGFDLKIKSKYILKDFPYRVNSRYAVESGEISSDGNLGKSNPSKQQKTALSLYEIEQ